MNSKIKTLHVWLLKNNFKKEASDLSQLEGEEERDLSSPYELSEVEKQQLGQPATKTYSYISEEDYPILREDILSRRMGNYGTEDFKLDPELTAYTPGETIGIIKCLIIKYQMNIKLLFLSLVQQQSLGAYHVQVVLIIQPTIKY